MLIVGGFHTPGLMLGLDAWDSLIVDTKEDFHKNTPTKD